MRVVVALLLLTAVLSVAMPAQAVASLTLLGDRPAPGEYYLHVVSSGINIVPASVKTDQVGQGRYEYTINGRACDVADKNLTVHERSVCRDTPWTDSTEYHFVNLTAGDVIGANGVNGRNQPLEHPLEREIRVLDARILSSRPARGDYLLTALFDGLPVLDPEAPSNTTVHFMFRIGGLACDASDTRLTAHQRAACPSRPYTHEPSYNYHDLLPGDTVGFEIVDFNGTSLPVPVVRDVTALEIKALSPNPVPGDFELKFSVDGFQIVPLGGNSTIDGSGHFVYLINGLPCKPNDNRLTAHQKATCSAEAETVAPSFPFKGLLPGDRPGVELVHADGSPLVPRAVLEMQVPGPAIDILSGLLHAGNETVTIDVRGFQLKPADFQSPLPDFPGQGHIHYLVNGKPCANACSADQLYATDKEVFTFHGLDVGDTVGIELVQNSHIPLDPPVRVEIPVLAPSFIRFEDHAVYAGTSHVDLKANGLLRAIEGYTPRVPGYVTQKWTVDGELCDRHGYCPDGFGYWPQDLILRNLRVGQVVAIEVVDYDHRSLSPPIRIATTVVEKPTLSILSGSPLPGTYVLEADTTGIDIVRPALNGAPDKPNEGRFQYLINGHPCDRTNQALSFHDRATCGAAPNTIAPTYTFRELESGDIVGVRLVYNDGQPMKPDIFANLTVGSVAPPPRVEPKKDSPAAGPLFLLALVGLALLRRHRPEAL